MSEYNRTSDIQLTEVTKSEPCIHCGKPDWCYRLGELTVCKRGVEPADGWHRTEKTDKDGSYFYAPDTPLKPIRAASKQEFFYPDRAGNPLLKVVRIDDGAGKKSFAQYHWNGKRWIKGCPEDIRPEIAIYRYQQIRKAIAQGRTIFFVEGEGVADALHKLGLAATTTLGGSGKYRAYGSYLDDLKGAKLVLCPDRDQPGLKHMEMVAKEFASARWLFAPPGDFYWQNLQASGGLDISDWIVDGATKDDVLNAIVDTPEIAYPKQAKQSSDNETLFAPLAEDNYILRAKRFLYSNNRWIAYNGQLYRWTGTHYELSDEVEEKQRIAVWCASTGVMTKAEDWAYKYATASHVNNIYNWLILDFGIARSRINPPGINCLNGRLTIDWNGNRPTWRLNPHNPDIPYTYCSQFNFDPNADPTNCDRLLACLDPEQQEILIRTLAASLDIATVRQYQKDRIRALMCKGDGSNGKDALREAVSQLYSFGVVSASISDFAVYDQQGRKFTLAKLEGARVSWSSENSNFNQLDSMETLKKAITGEPLDVEPKFINEYTINPVAVFLFNINKSPNLQASLEAIQTRYAVLSFNKTFKKNADPSKGELEADPRFRYDPDFIRQEIVPALLNKMLAALPMVAREGIDYSCTDQALSDIQRDTNHLWAFCQDVGLDYQVGGQVSVREIWEKLSQWYIDNGTAIVSMNSKGNEVLQFLCDPPHRGDKNVRGENQVFQRFQALFPKAKRGQVHSIDEGKKNRVTLDGIGFRDIQQSTDEHSKAVVRQLVRQLVSQQPALEANVRQPKPILPTLLQILDTYSKLSPRDQLSVKKMLLSDSKDNEIGLPGLQSSPSKDQLPYHCLTNCLTTALPNNSPEINANAAKADVQDISDNLGSNVVGGIGNINHDNSTKNFADPNNQKFKVGSKVAHVDPKRESYNWHGRITEINGDEAKVYWEERAQRKIRGGAVLKHALSELRLI